MTVTPMPSPHAPKVMDLRVGAFHINHCVMVGRTSLLLAADGPPDGRAGVLKVVATPNSDLRLAERAAVHARLMPGFFPEIWEQGVLRDSPYIWMEEIIGWTLLDLQNSTAAAGRPLPVSFTLHVMRRLLEVLHDLQKLGTPQSRPYIGRLSPGHIKIDHLGRLRFPGLCHQSSHPAAGSAVNAMATEGPFVLAPEQVEQAERRISATTDVYGWALTLYSLLAGENPFKKKGVLASMGRREIPGMAPIQATLPPLVPILSRALAPDPGQRPSVQELISLMPTISNPEMSGPDRVSLANSLRGPARAMRADEVGRQRCVFALERLGIRAGSSYMLVSQIDIKREVSADAPTRILGVGSIMPDEPPPVTQEGPTQILISMDVLPDMGGGGMDTPLHMDHEEPVEMPSPDGDEPTPQRSAPDPARSAAMPAPPTPTPSLSGQIAPPSPTTSLSGRPVPPSFRFQKPEPVPAQPALEPKIVAGILGGVALLCVAIYLLFG